MYLVYSGEMVQRIGALRLVGLATTVACPCCLAQFVALRPLGAAIVAPEVLWLSVLNAILCTAAPVLMVMMAIETHWCRHGRASRHGGPAVHHPHGNLDSGQSPSPCGWRRARPWSCSVSSCSPARQGGRTLNAWGRALARA